MEIACALLFLGQLDSLEFDGWPLRAPKILERFGAPFEMPRLECLDTQNVLGWAAAANEGEVRPDLCSKRRMKPQIQGAGAHAWILERRHGLATGTYNQWVSDDRFSGKQIFSEAQLCLNAPLSGSG